MNRFLPIFLLLPLTAESLSWDFEISCSDLPIASNTVEYASENCPDIAIFSSCVNHTGIDYSTEEELNSRLHEMQDFLYSAMNSCIKTCDDGDGGACYIAGEAMTPIITQIALGEDFDKWRTLIEENGVDPQGMDATIQLSQNVYFARACNSDIGAACRRIGGIRWQQLRNDPALQEATRQDGTNPAEAMIYFQKGCAAGDFMSCAQAVDFANEFPEFSGEDFNATAFVERICEQGSALICRQYRNRIQ